MPDYVSLGVAVIFVGFAVVVVAMLLSAREGGEREKPRVRGGGVVMIGPIPIIFGSDPKWASIAIVLAIVLIVIVLLAGGLVL